MCLPPTTPTAAPKPAARLLRPKQRTLTILSRPAPGEVVIEVAAADGLAQYHIFPTVPFSGCGRAWTFQGLAGKSKSHYEVNLGEGDDNPGGCECRGSRRFGYCRHMRAVKVLVERGDL